MKLNEQIDELYNLREQKRKLEEEIKKIGDDMDAKLAELMQTMDDVGTISARGGLATATVTEQVVPKIEDWGEVEQYVLENDAVYLLHRRIKSGPWKELLDAGYQVPGIAPFTKRSVSLTKLRD